MATKPASKVYIFFVIVTILIWIGSLIVQSVFMSEGARDLDNDINRINNVTFADEDDDEDTQIGPASWAFSIWFLIYSWQAVFLVYCVLSLFSRFGLHRVPIAVFPIYSITNLGGSGWTILSERYDMYWPDFGCIAAMPITLYICFFISVPKLNGRQCKYYLYTYCVHNAWAIYAGWTTVAMLLWLCASLIYADEPKMDQTMTATIMFGILMAELVVFCTLELTVLDKYLRHVWTHYIALGVAMTGSIIDNWEPTNRNSIIAVAIAGFLTCAFSIKVVKMLYCKRPDEIKQKHGPPSNEDVEKKYLEAQST